MTIKRPVNLFLTIFLAGIFLFLTPARGVVINEICPTGCASTGYQWIEIYNEGTAAIDLTGWKFLEDGTNHGLELSASSTQQDYLIDAGEYAIIAQNDANFFIQYPSFISTLFDSSWGALNKGGETIGLKDAGGNLVEEFSYSAVVNNSLERKDPVVSASDAGNWCEHESADTAGAVNVCPAVIPETPSTTPTITTQNTNNITQLRINELVPNPVSGNEWIEIYNPTTSSILIDGLKLFDAVGEIATPTGTIEANGFFAVELSSSKLNNTGGDSVIFKDATDTVVDSVSYGEVAKGNSIARNIDGSGSFVETTTLTKNAANQITAPVQPVQSNSAPSTGSTGSPQAGSGQTSSPQVSFQAGTIVINEIVSDPVDDANEFVELYNRTDTVVDLAGWWLEDGGETRTKLEGLMLPRTFFVIDSPNGNLNNGGDLIALFDPSGKIIDQLVYGSWDDGNLSDNAPPAGDPMSLARKTDGKDTNNDYSDFALTGSVTKGAGNKITSIASDGEKTESVLAPSEIIINEIFPNPAGSDAEDEFIELRNLGKSQIDLSGWSLGDLSAKKYKIGQEIIFSGGHIIFKRSMTGIALNNSGQEEVKLYYPSGALADKVKYEGSAPENQSYARRDDGTWAWTTRITPSVLNIIEGKSAAPIIIWEFNPEAGIDEEIIFDASDTTDPDGDKIKFTWDFGDGQKGEGDVVKHAYNKIGDYSVKLTATDSAGNAAEKAVKIAVANTPSVSVSPPRGGRTTPGKPAPLREGSSRFPSSEEGEGGVGGWIDLTSQIVISEILPNPVGSDSAEFIELYNPNDTAIDLSDYKLDDEDGGSRPYVLPDGTIIEPMGFLLLERSKTGLALNNTSDAVRILDQDNNVIIEAGYDDVIEGASYIYDVESGDWMWTTEVTPGSINVRTYPSTPPRQARGRSGQATEIESTNKKDKKIIDVELEKLRDNDVGDRVKFTGIVAVRPGVLSSQYFYAVSDDASVGIQVYMNKKDFPLLAVGDLVEVTGEISSAYGETRVKTSARDDIKLLKQSVLPAPQEMEIASISEESEGALLKIKGEITELKSSYMYIDDGTDELKVYFKKGAGIDREAFRVGDTVETTGLLGSTRAGYQLLPRGQDDIDIISVPMEEVEIASTGIGGQENMAETYLTATAGGLTSILIGLFARARGAMVFGLIKKAGKLAILLVKRGPRV